MKRPQILDKFLNSANTELEGLVTHARQLRRLQGQYQKMISENLAKNCQVANFQQGVLTLCCQSAAWATRAKMDKGQIVTALRENDAFAHLKDIQVITRPATQPIESKEKIKEISMSGESANIISSMAEAISDPALSNALQRLSRHKND